MRQYVMVDTGNTISVSKDNKFFGDFFDYGDAYDAVINDISLKEDYIITTPYGKVGEIDSKQFSILFEE